MVFGEPSKERKVETLFREKDGSGNDGETSDASNGHGLYRRACAIRDQRTRSESLPRGRTDGRQHGVMAWEGGHD